MGTQFINRYYFPPRYNHMRNRNNGRKGEGTYRFNKEQSYEGEFLRDSLHGQGNYKWLNVAFYDGGFYSNCKEGYANISFPDSTCFEGLFVGNQPFGPGILTYPNGRQDAGFWKGNKLVRLSRVVDFIIPRLAPTSAAKIKLLQFRRLIPVEEDNSSVTNILEKYHLPETISAPFSTAIYDRRSIFFDKMAFERAYFASSKRRIELPHSPSLSGSYEGEEDDEEIGEEESSLSEEFKESVIPSHCICPTDVFVMDYKKEGSVDICERESFAGENEMGILGYFNKYGIVDKILGEEEENESSEDILEEEFSIRDVSKVPKIVSWNRSELCTEMLKQIFRFRNFEGRLNFNLSKLMVGDRTAFRKTGENEMQCLHFLKMCSLGPAHVIKSILCAFQISEELMDARGNNSLMFAAATDKHDVIEVLLNYGVDKNSFNDEGLTPLNLCLLRRLAYAYKISNWETAFLPKEIDESQYEDTHAHGYPSTESISSLDRIFGDGMSLDESNILGLRSAAMSPHLSPSVVGRGSVERKQKENKKEISRTMLGISPTKMQGSLSIINWDWEFRPKKSVSMAAISNPTPTLNIKIIPKSLRRDEFQRSLQRSNKDKYLFEINFERDPELENEESNNSFRKKQNKKEEDLNSEEESTEDSMSFDTDPNERIAEIDKTIQLLLEKGADPNISEVPKPSIHLALYTKDIKTVHTLLKHGADPNSVLHSNEGHLTPLHVIVLQKPTPEYVNICDLLLNYKANPDKETLPEFSINEDEIKYLDPIRGRTPLHLLCMRPDLEYADPQGYLIKIALMLAKACHKKHFYNGHSYLTLAMLFGNVKLLKAFLHSELFDPKEVLGKDRGTCLHVLLSGELQTRTPYATSIEMCDLLIGAGADPLKVFKNPRYLLGTCVDYGYRELGLLREARFSEEFRGIKRSFSKGRDSLKDHERVIEHLAVIVGETAKLKHKRFLEVGRFQRYKPSTDRWRYHRGSARKVHRNFSEGMENLSSATFLESDDRLAKGSKERYQSIEEKLSKLILPSSRLRSKALEQAKKEVHDDKKEVQDDKKEVQDVKKEKEGKKEKQGKKEVQDKKEVQGKKEVQDKKEVHAKKEVQDKKELQDKKEVQDKKEKKGKKEVQDKKERLAEESEKSPKKKEGRKGKHADKSDEKVDDKTESEVAGKQEFSFEKSLIEIQINKKKTKKDEGKFSSEKDEKKKKDSLSSERPKELGLSPQAGKTKGKTKQESKKASENVENESQSAPRKDRVKYKLTRRSTVQDDSAEKTQITKKKKSVTHEEKEPSKKRRESEKKTEEQRGKKDERRIPEKKESLGDRKAETDKKEHSSEARERERSQEAGRTSRPSLGTRERASNVPVAERSSLRTVTEGRTSTTEVFPENLRRNLLRMYGNCANMDVNEFLMPYVVLRDGQLYYKFKGKATKQKEQYSLI